MSAIERDALNLSGNETNQNEGIDNENDFEEQTLSGENDVEYVEFSMSVRTSPKEQIERTEDVDETIIDNQPTVTKSRLTMNDSSGGFMMMSLAAAFNDNNHAMSPHNFRSLPTSASVLETLLEPQKLNKTDVLTENPLSSSSGSSGSSRARDAVNFKHTSNGNQESYSIGWLSRSNQRANARNVEAEQSKSDNYVGTLDKLIGDFNLTKRKRNWDQKIIRSSFTHAEPSTSTASIVNEVTHSNNSNTKPTENMQDISFWTDVFFNVDSMTPIRSNQIDSIINNAFNDKNASKEMSSTLKNSIINNNGNEPMPSTSINRSNNLRNDLTLRKYNFKPISSTLVTEMNSLNTNRGSKTAVENASGIPNYLIASESKAHRMLPNRKSAPAKASEFGRSTALLSQCSGNNNVEYSADSNFMQALNELSLGNDLLDQTIRVENSTIQASANNSQPNKELKS